MIRRLLPILLLGAMALPGRVQAHGSAAQYAPPAKLALKLTDFPAGWTQVKAQTRTPAQSDSTSHLAPGTLESHGRLSAYETEFVKAASAPVGLYDIKDTVAPFRTAAGAHWQVKFSRSQAHKALAGTPFHAISVGRLGDEAVGYEWSATVNGAKLTAFAVIVRRGAYVVLIVGGSKPDVGVPPTVLRLAHVVDERIRRTH